MICSSLNRLALHASVSFQVTDSTSFRRVFGVQANGIPGGFVTHPMTFEVFRL